MNPGLNRKTLTRVVEDSGDLIRQIYESVYYQYAPGPLRTAGIVFKRIFRSKSERPLIDVLQVHSHPVIEANVASTIHLPKASHPWLDAKTAFVPLQIDALDIPHRQGSWTNETHVAFEHVDELRQLIDAETSQKFTNTGYPRDRF